MSDPEIEFGPFPVGTRCFIARTIEKQRRNGVSPMMPVTVLEPPVEEFPDCLFSPEAAPYHYIQDDHGIAGYHPARWLSRPKPSAEENPVHKARTLEGIKELMG